MMAKIIPLEITYRLEDPTSYPGAFPICFPREIAERDAKRALLAEVEKHIQVHETPPGEFPDRLLVARVFLADGWEGIEQAARSMMDMAASAHQAATQELFRIMAGRNALAEERAKFEEDMKRAQADFRERLQASLQELWGYDECAGRR